MEPFTHLKQLFWESPNHADTRVKLLRQENSTLMNK